MDMDKKNIVNINKEIVDLVVDLMDRELEEDQYKSIKGLLNNYIGIKKRAISIKEATELVEEYINKS